MIKLTPIIILLLLTTLPLLAHAPSEQHIRHNIKLTANPHNIDITISITYTPTQATHLFTTIDTNHDSKITRQETDHFIAQLNFPKAQLPRLTANSKPIPLIELYTPTLDITQSEKTTSATLHLSYFATTPPKLPGRTLILHNNFNPNQTVTLAFIALGTQGLTLQTNSPITALIPANTPKKLTATCLTTTPNKTTTD